MFAEIGATPAGPTANSCGNHEVDPVPLEGCCLHSAGLRASRCKAAFSMTSASLGSFANTCSGSIAEVLHRLRVNGCTGDVGQTNFTQCGGRSLAAPTEDDGTPVLIQRRQGIQKVSVSREDRTLSQLRQALSFPFIPEIVGLRPQKGPRPVAHGSVDRRRPGSEPQGRFPPQCGSGRRVTSSKG